MEKFCKRFETNSLYGLRALAHDFDEQVIDEMFDDFDEIDVTLLSKTEPTEHDLKEVSNNGNI